MGRLADARARTRVAGSLFHVTGAALAISAVALLVSCAAPAPTPSPDDARSAEHACLQLSDVGTLVFNMRAARDAERIPGEEYQGAMYLAGSMVRHIETTDDSALNSVVDELTAAAGANAVDPTSDAWTAAFADVSDSCTDILGEFGVAGWVGG